MNEENGVEKKGAEKQFDIFAWANNLARVKNELETEFFVVNKKYSVYHLPVASELKPQIAPVFLYEILNEIEKGAGLGLEIREYEKSEAEPGVLLYSTRAQVNNAKVVLDTIENQRRDIETFNEYDHEFKTIKMIVAKFSHKDFQPFYIVKGISGASSLNERSAWEIGSSGKLEEFKAATAFKVPTDNQVLIAEDRIFAFSPKKFEAMFGYAYKQQAIADKKVEQILARYQLNFPEGQDLNTLISGRTKTINKLQDLELGTKTQEEIVSYSENMALDLMTADDGAIIIMDGHDVDTFVSLLNDDFMTSDLTGLKYEIKGKKMLDTSGGE
ncbi:DUF4868 domain-containing protein [Candidatus Saccharibacteria bacterium]|nr:DUF4868 domain-containing protein [Candidatus Saccharibacteria bacterium]